MVLGDTEEVTTHRLRATVLDAPVPECHRLSKARSEPMLLASYRGSQGLCCSALGGF